MAKSGVAYDPTLSVAEAFVGRGFAFKGGLYLIGGAGSTDFGGDELFTVNFGIGYRLAATDWLALRIDVRDHMFETDILGTVSRALEVECRIHTDVAAAALAEFRFGAAQGTSGCIYATVGTGIGAAALVDGRSPAARFHEEMGHMLIPRHPDDDFRGACAAHEHCLEGFASATSIEQRWKQPPHDLADDHPCWDIEAFYLATFCVNVMRTLSPEVILLGGGVLQQAALIGKVHGAFIDLMNGYHTVADDAVPELIQHAALEPNAGLIGALVLAQTP